MKRSTSQRYDLPLQTLAPPGAQTPPSTPAQSAQADAASMPVMRVAPPPAIDGFSCLPQELRSLITHQFASRDDRIALSQSSRRHYATPHPQRSLDFFVTHCHQIAALPREQILGHAASPLSQPLLDAVPGASTLVELFKLHCGLDKQWLTGTEVGQRLGRIGSADLQTAFALFAQWSEAYAPAADGSMPFVNADFLGSGPLLARIDRLTNEEENISAALALTTTLLTWSACHGAQHLLMDVDAKHHLPLPPTWCALGELTGYLMRYSHACPHDRRIAPELMLRLLSWCHFVQESGLLLAGSTYDDAHDEFAAFGVMECISELLEKLAAAPEDPEQTPSQLAGKVLEWQATAHRTQPPNSPHMASLRVFGMLMEAGSSEIASGSAQGVTLLRNAIEGTRREFLRFARAVQTAPVTGFGLWEDDGLDPLSDDESFDAPDVAINSWDCVLELIGYYGDRNDIIKPDLELMAKLYGLFHAPIRTPNHLMSNEQVCQLRLIDSMLATLRELSLRVATLPEPSRSPLAQDLRAIVQLWPIVNHQDLLEEWIA